jgi:DNA-binding transcriptional regulator YiaG
VNAHGKTKQADQRAGALPQAGLAGSVAYLNVTAGYISQLERGAARPKGAALVLLDVIRRKGIEVIL